MITEDDDDTHICLKCHTTITGLDNYVSHRKTGCVAQTSEHSKPRPLSSLMTPDEQDFSLKADDFFSLLELQSSSKKSSLQVSTSGKSSSGVLTRSKATAVIQASNLNRGSDWIGGHQLRELGNEDNQTKLIKAVANISGHHQIKKVEPTRLSYEDDLEEDTNDEYDEDDEEYEEECHSAPPRSHTGGKWKPTTSPIQWLRPSSSHSHEYRTDWDNPPPSHTGGKWKPMLPANTRRISDGEEEDDKNIPPPGHTKGKWIPGRNTIESSNQTVEEIPPLRKSCGTVQYWCGPCNRRLASKIVYDRHLRSELHFKRTLHEREFEGSAEYLNQKTSTHKRAKGKRIIKKPERIWSTLDEKTKKDDDDIKKEKMKKQSIRCEVCRSKVATHLIGKHLISHYHCRKRNTKNIIAQQMVLDHIENIVFQCPFQCSACHFYCNSQTDFLRHWRSQYHYNVTETTKGYYFCSFCKYESQHNELMEEHLLSDVHREVVSVINRSVPIIIKKIIPVQCVTCRKQFRYNGELRKHCIKANHILGNSGTDKYQGRHCCSECNLVFKSSKSLQRHMQRRHGKNYFFCSVCSMTFDSYADVKLHRSSAEHKYKILSRDFEKGFSTKDISRACQYCFKRFSNVLLLKQHLQEEHPEHVFSCPQCGKKFTLSQEVTRHIKAKQCSFESNPSAAYFNCEKCPFKTNSEAEFFFHIALHTEPALVYDTHDQDGSSSKKPAIVQYACPVCHKYFRKTSLRCHIRQHTNERPFKCMFCKASYTRRNNLNDHIRMNHEDEQKKKDCGFGEFTVKAESEMYICSTCGNRYNQQDQLQNHIQLVHNEDADVEKNKKKQEIILGAREKRYLCSFCGRSFLKKYTLLQHAKVHTGKEYRCPHTGCLYRARSAADLKPHLATHSDLRPFACQRCDYRTKTKAQLNRHEKIHGGDDLKKIKCSFCPFTARERSHLRRHLRLHTGAKPYKCPHCTYTCNNLENLRKHVLSTNKHPGKCIYECKFCEGPGDEYASNFAKEFRMHLITAHSDKFPNMKEAASYVLGIYNAEEDPKLGQAFDVVPIYKPITNKETKPSKSPPQPAMKKVHQSEETKSDYPSISTTIPSSTSAVLLTSAANHDIVQRTVMDSELLSMVVVANTRDDVVYVEMPSAGTDTWTMEGYYDVEESGTLVPFHSEEGDLLVQHFDDNSH